MIKHVAFFYQKSLLSRLWDSSGENLYERLVTGDNKFSQYGVKIIC